MPKDFTLETETTRLVLSCDEALAPQAAWMLRTVANLAGTGRGLEDGVRIRMGWSALTLRQEESGLRIFQPDFTGDALTELSPDLSLTLRVMSEQTNFLTATGMDDRDDLPLFTEKVVLQNGVMNCERVYLERRDRTRKDDTGWFVGPAEGQQAGEGYEAVRVYQLLNLRPALLTVLGLPPGCLAVYHRDEIEFAADETGMQIWPPGLVGGDSEDGHD